MTVIAAFWRHDRNDDGADGESSRACRKMLTAQERFVSTETELLASDGVALGRRPHPLLPEDRHDRGPVRFADDRCIMVADIRLDDRADLARALGIAERRAAEMSDTALLAEAWERWGDRTPDRLVGDFALAVWDGARRTLTLARDPLGQKPLFYHEGGGLVAASSMPCGLHALAEVPRRAEIGRAAQFLALIPEAGPDSFFEGVKRVEPGHVVTIDASGASSRRYWPGAIAPVRFARDEDYAQALRERFDAAVEARLRGCGAVVATHLSGGLDSSSVAATAARMMPAGGRVAAFTAVPRAGYDGPVAQGRIADEWAAASATAALYPQIVHRAIRSDRDPVAALDETLHLYERPFPNLGNAGWWHAANAAARAAGASVLLTGELGNMTISYAGHEALPELLARGDARGFARLARALAQGGASPRSLAARALGPFLPQALWALAGRARGTRTPIHEVAGLRASVDLGDPRFGGAGTNLHARPPRRARDARLRGLGWADPGPFNKGTLGGWGIDVRDPTSDRRVIEYCLAVPAEQFILNGRPRSLARRAFADRLPPEVVGETRLGFQAADWFETMGAARGEIAAELNRIAASPAAAELIDVARLRRLVDDWPTGEWETEPILTAYRSTLLRGLAAGHFLRNVGE